MTPAVPGRVLGSVTSDVLPSHQHHCNVDKWWNLGDIEGHSDMEVYRDTRVHRVFTDMEHPHRCWPRELDQRSVHHGGSAAHGPFFIVGGQSAPHGTSRLCHLSTLQWFR